MNNPRSALTLISAGDMILQAADVKQQLNLDFDDTDWDDWIEQRIADAQNYVDGRDGRLGRALLTQQWKLTREYFGRAPYPQLSRAWQSYGEIEIPLPPLQSVDSIKYLDLSGTEQTVDSTTYRVIDGGGSKSSIIPKAGFCWPSPVLCAPDAVRITFTAGYEDLDALNTERPKIRHAMLLLIAHWFQNREGVTDGRINQPFTVPYGIDDLLIPHQVGIY